MLADQFIRQVEGDPDRFAFQYDFTLEGKAADQAVVTQLDDGDLLIEGYASVFEGLDRHGENFEDGAFDKGIHEFVNGQGALCYHHKFDQGIGTVLDLQNHEGKGLWMRARVDKQETSSPLYYIYNGIKKGTYKGLSVGGFFTRAIREGVQKIVDVDFAEISVTPVSMHPKTSFSVVAGKALQNEEPEAPDADLAALTALAASLSSFTEVMEGKALPKAHDPAAAEAVNVFLSSLGRVRTLASFFREHSENDDVSTLANDVESTSVAWESKLHSLAAKIGPLPPAPISE